MTNQTYHWIKYYLHKLIRSSSFNKVYGIVTKGGPYLTANGWKSV